MGDWWKRYEDARVTGGYVLEVCVKMVIVMGFLRWQAANFIVTA